VSDNPYDLQPTARPSPEAFISYARRDYDKGRRITDQPTSLGVDFWLDQQTIEGGANYVLAIVRGIKLSCVTILMCSNAALRSRNVNQEIMLAWKYARPYLPLLLEPVDFSDQVEYFLAGCQWPAQIRADLTSLRALASFNNRIWPIAADRITSNRQRRETSRDLGAQHRHKIGSNLGLAIEAERAGYLLLIDEGPEGIIYCLSPSWFAPDKHIRKGMNYLPQAGAPYESFQVSGKPGREQLLAVITDEPLDLDWMPPDQHLPARVLNAQDVELLLIQLRQLNPATWVALATYFDVVL
jgi:hypothetical protein